MKRANLGSGKDYLPGWINVDIEPTYKKDVVADLHKPFPFTNDSLDEIKASDILEHFTKEDGEKFLRECHRTLKFGGKLFIRTHNVFAIFDQFSDDPQVMIHFLYGNTKETGVFGAHKFAYTKEYAVFLLKKIGFKITSFETKDTNFVFSALKTKTPPQLQVNIGTNNLVKLKSFTTSAQSIKLSQLPKIDIFILSGGIEKITYTILAKILSIPVIWIETEKKWRPLVKNTFLSKIFYRTVHKIPTIVIFRTKENAQVFMLHTRVSLVKIMVIPNDAHQSPKFKEVVQDQILA